MLIVVTHIFQEYKIQFAGYTNIGVQMFLVISGFLMGQADTISWKKWTLRRILRIIPSYYIILLMTAIAYWLFLNKNIVDAQFLLHFSTLHFLFFPNYPFWGGHLWYITAIALCYLSFPILVFTRRLNKIAFLLLYLVLIPIFLASIFYKTAMPYRLCGDIYCFIAGFAGTTLFKRKIPNLFTAATLIIAIVIVTFHIIFAQNNYWNIYMINQLFKLLWPWERCMCGVSLCVLFYLPVFNILKNNAILNFIDKYSYEIYLSHKNFILGSLSLLYISKYLAINLVVALSSSLICAFIVAKSANIIKLKIEEFIKISPNE